VTTGTFDGRLKGRVAVVTGTAGGQGRAAALRFARDGARVVGCDINPDGAAQTVSLVEEAGGDMTSLHPLDLLDEQQVATLIRHAVDTYGGLDILYNNAAAMRTGTVENLSMDDLDFTLEHEIKIILLAVKQAIPAFRQRGGGVIINTASITGMQTGSGVAGNARGILAHAIGKAGVIRLGSQLAVELAPLNIRVNTISPGPIDTPVTHDVFAVPDVRAAYLKHMLVQRIGSPDDIAAAAAFLASDEASFITGVNLPVDGGWTGSGGMGQPHEEVEAAFEAAAAGFASGRRL
jgi:meso-butanediol dehydrogenase / (S,S)-butanediol dehydrogenase / diacetyl reductase